MLRVAWMPEPPCPGCRAWLLTDDHPFVETASGRQHPFGTCKTERPRQTAPVEAYQTPTAARAPCLRHQPAFNAAPASTVILRRQASDNP
ncbi:hypothetical protein THIOKS12070034 [Thiocapsa sp. KS1]|nr:hypothetical protein THIOKS12070034 [Thiocapsa sp. KS1]